MTTSRFGRTNRRRFVAGSALGGAAILAAGQLLPEGQQASAPAVLAQDDSSDVPMFRGNPARTGEMPGPGPDASNGMEVLWKFAAGGESIWRPPAIVDGVAFLGTSDGILYAINTGDGSERWRLVIDEVFGNAPAVVDGVAYIGSIGGGFIDGGQDSLYAVNVDDGTVRWRFSPSNVGFFSSPAAVNGVVYFGSWDTNLYAVNAEDGTERWRFAGGREGYSRISASPAVADGVVYVGSDDKTFYAVDAEDGTERWRLTSDAGFSLSPTVAGSVVYLTNGDVQRFRGDQLFALNATDGTERWRFSAGGPIQAEPTVADGVVYVGGHPNGADRNKYLYAINADDGTERWRSEIDNSNFAASVADGVVYVGNSDGSLYAINAEDGTERWRFVIGDGVYSSPVVMDGVVYVGSKDGSLYAIGARVPRLGAGGTARVTETTSLRGGPAPTAVERAELEQDVVVTITGESVTAGDTVWWPVTVDVTGDQGWVEASTLEPLSSGPEPTATA